MMSFSPGGYTWLYDWNDEQSKVIPSKWKALQNDNMDRYVSILPVLAIITWWFVLIV